MTHALAAQWEHLGWAVDEAALRRVQLTGEDLESMLRSRGLEIWPRSNT